ncbi:MAG TPA: patatin-like phospholipase family protein [Caulobacteraceae bacterium]
MTRTPHPGPLTSLADLFDRQAAAGEAVGFCLPGGVPLFEAGDEANQLYFLRAGRLAVKLGDGGPPGGLGLIHPGEAVGEMALIAGVPHTADVFALRDSELDALPREAFLRATQAEPGLALDIARLVLARVHPPAHVEASGSRRVFGFIGVSPGVRVRAFVDQVAERIRILGHSVAVVADETGPDTPEWLTGIEAAHEYVLYAAEYDEAYWKIVVGRQVDAVVRVGLGSSPPPAGMGVHPSPPAPAAGDLVLLQDASCAVPRGSAAWTAALAPLRLFHVRAARQDDLDRLARVITGRAVGLVLSGGAARAYAHIGAVRALRETGVPIDFIGGVSMGAIVGAGIAMGWDDDELDRRIRKAFVDSSPVADLTWPMIAMTRGEKVRERLAENFGDRQICDLWLPLFCGTTNLTTGAYQIDRRGPVREVLRASLSLPGVLPPVTVGEDVLVDGAVLNNFPADVMRTLHDGPIIGVDVGRGRSIEAREVQVPKSLLKWFLSGEWRNGPPIVSLLMRAATVTAARDTAVARQETDLLVLPDVDRIEIRNWKAYDPAVAEGRRAMLAALAGLDRPVTELRRGGRRAAQ